MREMTQEKGIIHVRIDKQVEKKFRIEVARLYGGQRGSLSRAVQEAIELWVKEKKSNHQ